MIEHQLSIAKDGSSTRINRATGGVSTPDVTIVGKEWSEKCAWSVGEHLENSDHLTTHQSIFGTTDGEEMVSIGKDSESLSTYIAI